MNKNWKKGIFFLLLFLAVMPMIHMYREQRMQKEIAEKILRFHVIANSDSREDQELKLKVRDAVGLYMKDQMKEVTNRKEAEETANANLKKIEKVAEDSQRRKIIYCKCFYRTGGFSGQNLWSLFFPGRNL
jgi:stage II sporulation protein R